MTAFLIGAACFLLLVFLLLLAGRRASPRAADDDDANLRWYEQRAQEIAQAGDNSLVADAQLRLLEDGGLAPSDAALASAPSLSASSLGRSRFWWASFALSMVVMCCAAALYLETGAIEDVLIYRELGTITPEDGDDARLALLARIEARSAARPGNLQYLSLLGRLYMAAEDFTSAASTFQKLALEAPGDSQTLAMAAQARFLAAGREFDETSQLLAERALAIDPIQRTALGLLGMASFEKGVYVAAVSYWERLRELEPSDSPGYQMLSDVIAVARERGSLPSDSTDLDPVAESPGIAVALALADGPPVSPESTVFVFARAAGSAGGMPVAVRRLPAGQLPTSIVLRDSDAMAGQLLSEAGSVTVSAQLSSNGQPGEANALYAGRSEPVSASQPAAELTLTLNPR